MLCGGCGLNGGVDNTVYVRPPHLQGDFSEIPDQQGGADHLTEQRRSRSLEHLTEQPVECRLRSEQNGCFSFKSKQSGSMDTLDDQSAVAECSKIMKGKGAAMLQYKNKSTGDPRSFAPYKGQLKLAVYVNSGLLTVHVIAARHLRSSVNKKLCNSYVKLSLFPDESKRTKCKTEIGINTNMPTYDEKFSFELLPNDSKRRLFISVWNKHTTDRHCEQLGCMSFGIRHILQQTKTPIDGWYFLLHENVGKRKHLHVHEHKPDETSLYMDMQGIDLPGVSNTSEDSGLDNGEPTAKNPPREAVKKVHLGTGIVALADVNPDPQTPEIYRPASAVTIVHQAPADELEALKETIEEQKKAIGMLKQQLRGQSTEFLADGGRGVSPVRGIYRANHRSDSPALRNNRALTTPLPIVNSTSQKERLGPGFDGGDGEKRCPIHDHHEPTCPMAYARMNGGPCGADDDDDDLLSSSTDSDSETDVFYGPPMRALSRELLANRDRMPADKMPLRDVADSRNMLPMDRPPSRDVVDSRNALPNGHSRDVVDTGNGLPNFHSRGNQSRDQVDHRKMLPMDRPPSRDVVDSRNMHQQDRPPSRNMNQQDRPPSRNMQQRGIPMKDTPTRDPNTPNDVYLSRDVLASRDLSQDTYGSRDMLQSKDTSKDSSKDTSAEDTYVLSDQVPSRDMLQNAYGSRALVQPKDTLASTRDIPTPKPNDAYITRDMPTPNPHPNQNDTHGRRDMVMQETSRDVARVSRDMLPPRGMSIQNGVRDPSATRDPRDIRPVPDTSQHNAPFQDMPSRGRLASQDLTGRDTPIKDRLPPRDMSRDRVGPQRDMSRDRVPLPRETLPPRRDLPPTKDTVPQSMTKNTSPSPVPSAESGQVIEVQLRRCESGFGITLAGDRPARILTVTAGSPAHRAGILPHDIVLAIDHNDVSHLSADTVARAVRFCDAFMRLRVRRLRLPVVGAAGGGGGGGGVGGRGNNAGPNNIHTHSHPQTHLQPPPYSHHQQQKQSQQAGRTNPNPALPFHPTTSNPSTDPKPHPPERHASKSSALLRDTLLRDSAKGNNSTCNAPTPTELFPWGPQPQHGSLESQSRTSEGESMGTSEGDADNSYLDMRAHWALMKSPV